jgi:murein DD-endopeptidase MepM/ murein hydrolase activator NlpD
MLCTRGQDTISFLPPLSIPMYLSGNFGEIRTDHFHSGIDIKTQGSIGHLVYAVDEGFVSRIKVQSNGYGKTIYVSHPNGYTSVYGHLDRYREDIAAYVKDIQYEQRSHTVDLYLKQGTFPLERGELIAYSGNTGSSTGPHLHFEIRSSANQHPTNVLSYNFDIKDGISPRFRSLFFYPMDSECRINGKAERISSKVRLYNGTYSLPHGVSIEAWGILGISVEVFDYLDGSANRCGIYSLEMYVDGQLSYKHVMDEFSFSETRYINASTDYEERIRSSTKAHRLHRLPNDQLRIYDRHTENKALLIDEQRDYPVRIVATDVAGNSSSLKFTVRGRAKTSIQDSTAKDLIYMDFRERNHFQNGPVKVEIPANALYQELAFSSGNSPALNGTLTPFYQIASEEVAIHRPYTLSIRCPEIESSLYDKLLLVSHDAAGNLASAGGVYHDGAVVASLRKFGKYAVALDTIAPEISFRGKLEEDMTGRKELRFTIRDELSGISSYEGYIDNHWALFEYDPKNELLTYTFDPQYLTPDSEHELELYVSDDKGNVNLFLYTFIW